MTINDSKNNGAVAQLGERLDGIQKVVGSIPSSSTMIKFFTYILIIIFLKNNANALPIPENNSIKNYEDKNLDNFKSNELEIKEREKSLIKLEKKLQLEKQLLEEEKTLYDQKKRLKELETKILESEKALREKKENIE